VALNVENRGALDYTKRQWTMCMVEAYAVAMETVKTSTFFIYITVFWRKP